MNEALLVALQEEVPEEGQIIAETFRAARTGDCDAVWSHRRSSPRQPRPST